MNAHTVRSGAPTDEIPAVGFVPTPETNKRPFAARTARKSPGISRLPAKEGRTGSPSERVAPVEDSAPRLGSAEGVAANGPSMPQDPETSLSETLALLLSIDVAVHDVYRGYIGPMAAVDRMKDNLPSVLRLVRSALSELTAGER